MKLARVCLTSSGNVINQSESNQDESWLQVAIEKDYSHKLGSYEIKGILRLSNDDIDKFSHLKEGMPLSKLEIVDIDASGNPIRKPKLVLCSAQIIEQTTPFVKENGETYGEVSVYGESSKYAGQERTSNGESIYRKVNILIGREAPADILLEVDTPEKETTKGKTQIKAKTAIKPHRDFSKV